MWHNLKIRSHELGLYFQGDQFRGLLMAGTHWFFDPEGQVRVDVVSQRLPWLTHKRLADVIRSGVLDDRALIVDLLEHERGLVWINGRLSYVLTPGQYALWLHRRDVRVEILDICAASSSAATPALAGSLATG